MKNMTTLTVLIAGFTLALSSSAAAQTSTKASIDVNGGAQTQAHTFSATTSFPLYGETATVSSAQSVDGGGLFDVSGGYRIYDRLSVRVGFSIFSKSGSGSLVASIPNPAVINKPTIATNTASDLKHKEVATHLMAVWSQSIAKNIEVDLSAGPSFFHLTQDVLTATVPAGTQTANVATVSESANATGANVGASVNYLFTPNYGIGVFMRYAAAVAHPTSGNIHVGGFQIGGGLRLRF